MPPSDESDPDYEEPSHRDIDDDDQDSLSAEDDTDRTTDWNPRSVAKKALWSDPVRKAEMLAKRRATAAAKRAAQGLPEPKPPPPPKRSASEVRRAAALEQRFVD